MTDKIDLMDMDNPGPDLDQIRMVENYFELTNREYNGAHWLLSFEEFKNSMTKEDWRYFNEYNR